MRHSKVTGEGGMAAPPGSHSHRPAGFPPPGPPPLPGARPPPVAMPPPHPSSLRPNFPSPPPRFPVSGPSQMGGHTPVPQLYNGPSPAGSSARIHSDHYNAPPAFFQAPPAAQALPPLQFSGPSPGLPQPGSPSGVSPLPGVSRIDPTQIPSPCPQNCVGTLYFETRVNGQANAPPPATSRFIVKDTGNCSPRMMRCSLYQIPFSADLLATSGMPLAIMVQPLALPDPNEDPIQIVDFGESGPVRCSRCKGYMNAFMKFIDYGRRFTCNLCGFTNVTPRGYQCNLGADGRRRDADERPELRHGTVEYVASKEFLVRDPMPPVFFFLVDVSMNAVQTGATAAACSAIHRALGDLPGGPRTRVGVATFDTSIHFYNLSKVLQQPSMFVVPDVQDVYTPLYADLCVPLFECQERLGQLLTSIPTMFETTQITDSVFGAAIKGAYLAIKPTGGKLLVFQSVLPSVGIGSLTGREVEGRTGNEKEALTLLLPADKVLETMSAEFAKFQVCVDLFLTSQSYVDIASLGVVPKTTGGQIYYYHQFNSTLDSAKLYNDLRWNLTRPQGLEAVLRVRCSQGLQVLDYFGNFHRSNVTDIDLPAIDCDKNIMVTLKYNEKLQDGSDCCFQCALLYTTVSGERRIRVNTISLPCTGVLANLFRGADLDAQLTYILKKAAHDATSTPLVQLKAKVTEQCVNILYAYRKNCASACSAGQLILPEALKLLPLYTLALIKSIGFKPDVRVDERSYWLSRVVTLSASLAVPVVYPRMFAIHEIPPKDGDGLVLPPTLPLSSDRLDHDGILLLENGEDAYILVGKAASNDILYQLFGVHSIHDVVPGRILLQEYENAASKRLAEVVNEIRRQRCSYLRLCLVKRGDPQEMLFFSFLVEDKLQEASYVEFLVRLHKHIQVKMES